jgi:hypothetical protein
MNVLPAVKKIWALTGAIPYLRYAIFGLVLLLVMVAVVANNCGTKPSELEKKIEQKEDEAVTQQIEAKRAEVNAKSAEIESKEAGRRAKEKVKKADEVRHTNVRNIPLEEANKARCEAYPEDPGCK